MSVPTDFDGAAALLAAARRPADVFGADETDATHIYRELAKLLHPDRARTADTAAATAAFAHLTTLWASRRGVPVTIASRRHNYSVGALLASDDLANFYAATITDPAASEDVVLKVGRDPGCNDLIAAEALTLRHIAAHAERGFEPYVPRLLDGFSYREATTGVRRTTNVFAQQAEFVSLAEVRAAYPDGIDPRDAAWMWRRLLVAIGHAHRAGVVHGAVLPEHVLIHPAEHGLMLVNWCYSAIDGGCVPAVIPRYEKWYPPEVTRGERPGPGTDIHLATRCVVALVGARIPAPLARFARGCTQTSLAARPNDAWEVLAELDETLRRLYGPRTFRPFTMPAGRTSH